MSGLTPLIDTLLHQVLGKRVDVPASSRPLNPPVMPLLPAEAAKAVHSDSRLDARLPQGLPGVLPGGEKAGDSRQARGQLPQLPPSAVATLSPAARTIADVLLRHPAQPSVVSPLAPLLEAGTAASAPLADRLQQSISGSGLFYESHLARWYRGEMPLQALAREPQFWAALAASSAPGGAAQERPSALLQLLFPRAAPVPPAGSLADEAALRTAGAQAERSSSLLQSLLARPAQAAVAAPVDPDAPAAAPGAGVDVPEGGEAELPALRRALDTVRQQLAEEGWSPPAQAKDAAAMKEMLQGVVRHQLELLVAPVLRWEGQVWPGVFLAMQIQAPTEDERGAARRESAAGEGDGEAEWQAQLSLQLNRLGSLDLSLRWRGDRLNLLVSSPSDELLAGIERDRQALCERLRGCGFAEVELRALKRNEEVPGDGG